MLVLTYCGGYMMKVDGHVHTPFCPHGTNDSFEQYIYQALKRGYQEISFTEHAPLPLGFVDTTPDKDSGMNHSKLEDYFTALTSLKRKYRSDIKINIGLEIDFIEGYENGTTDFLNKYGPYLDDSILSVHFLKKEDHYFCLDFSPETFSEMVHLYGSVNAIYEHYFKTLLMSITFNLGQYKPKRIGHLTLVHKFQKQFPATKSFTSEIHEILNEISKQELQIDYNGAGVIKPLCGETYPPEWVIKEALKQKIPLIYGSDAHSAKDLAQGYDKLYLPMDLSSPTTSLLKD